MLQANPRAQEHVRLQRALDESLGRLFRPGEASIAAPMQAGRGSQRWKLWSLAAAVLVLGLFGFWAVFMRAPAAGSSPLGPLYRAQLAAGFVPKEVCTTRDEFAKWVKEYFGQALYPPATHDGVEFLGWSYGPAVSGNSGVLLARVRGKEVIVVLDRTVREKKQIATSGDPGLHSFRKQFGTIVLYEVTPFDEQSILPLLSTSAGPGP